ncbi:polysaccharide deacetylase family protein [Mycolicibacterium litorale]|uniref:Polysaccharide deacetylase n=1 Tax=Mycolicibacterium litorale TaxID=758802 RepID=A0AAD1IK54_9MYCO|nr:polysaccharide deacetylase family protein [Mycolicibacterium litorale]MCV7416042.1 polysaccharide deacetylase family protein [Mycolicibacterium litorale]TDY09294.1 polysaccharide deacetylase [Mycolicibacterium litorale]BBY17237.1 polysaccharide deacetylase [Mycolicibacterium litorale]
MTDHRPVASLSFDLDNVWSFLKTHGDPEWETRPSYLTTATPRIVEFLGESGLRSTVFVIGADADRDDGAEAVRAFAAGGHEIGNHSYEHEPWLQRYSADRVAAEIDRTHAAIVAAGAPAPTGFRGPGYSTSATLERLLVERGYAYDASTFPTWIGPLARAHHFRTATLTAEQRADRGQLFGGAHQALLPLRPHRSASGIAELPVTTMPLLRIPIHGSYLMQLYAVSPRVARLYFSTAVRLCRARGIGMTMLLHPTDLLDRRDAPALDFFPGMGVPAREKFAFMRWVTAAMQRHFTVLGTRDHVLHALEAESSCAPVP